MTALLHAIAFAILTNVAFGLSLYIGFWEPGAEQNQAVKQGSNKQ